MNKIYKVIWSEARKCYVVVAEIAKNHGKNNVRSIVERLAVKSAQAVRELFTAAQNPGALPAMKQQNLTPAQWIVPLMLAGCLLQPASVWATQTTQITDKNGNSLINGTGVHNIYAQKLIQNNNVDLAVNQFKDFKITQGDIANMYFSLNRTGDEAANLVNLVQNKIDVQGTVNAIKGNKIGGNLYFISPKGMMVGPTGVINAGRFVALAPTSDYFDDLKDDEKLAYQFHHDIANFSKRNGGAFTAMEDMELNSDATIDIQGKINTRSGIVLGANKITVANGAVLKSQKDLDFTGLVNAKDTNGNVLTNATFDVETMNLNPAADDSGDIILRSTANNKYENAPTKPLAELENIIMETSNSATVEVNGSIESDGVVELYAEATTTFDNTTWNGWNVSEIGSSLATQLGFNWEADWVDKTNTAKVTLGETGSVRAGRIASLQANAGINVQIVAATSGAKMPNTSEAIPVIAVSVAKVKNKALVDVAGSIHSDGNISLSASGGIRTNMITRAAANVVNNHDKGNQIVTGVTWVTGDSISQVNIQDKKDDQGNSLNNTAITAGGDFSVKTGSNSDMTLVTTVEGMDETFASTGISVLDYDSASNVNIERSVEAKSIKVDAENNVARLDITADNSNGEGGGASVKWMITGRRNADTIAGLLKNKIHLPSLTSGGKLGGMENAFKNAQEYVTAGAGIAVVDSSNTAHISVAPGVTLKATGPATVETSDGVKPGGDVSLSAYTHVDKLHHYAAGEANKVDRDTQSKVTVAAGVLYSSIENDASVELQSDTKNQQGVTLESVNGSVNLAAKTVQIYDPLEIFKTIDDRFKLLEKMLKDLGHECEELTNLHAETVTTKTQLENGSISESEAVASVLSYADTFTDFLSKEGNNLIQLDKGIQVLLDDIGAIFGPESYTNYYVRSYTVTNGQNGSNAAIGASLNLAELHNKSIVSIGEKASITAGRDIRVNTTTDTNVVSFTGNGGQYLALSESNGSGIGASVAVQDFSGDSIILSGKDVTMRQNASGNTWLVKDEAGNDVSTSGSIALNAKNEMIQTAIILSAGKADSNLSVSGSVNVLTGDSNSLILVDDETVMTAAGNVIMSANNDTTVTNIAGGLALGSSKTNASVGAGVAVNYLGVNSMAVMGDNGTGDSVTNTGTDTETTDTTEKENKKKAQKTLDAARKLAKERATVKKMDKDFNLSDKKLNESMGAKTATAGTAKGSISAKNVYVTGNSDGTINTVALEGASNSENHSAFDTFDKWSKRGAAAQNETTTAMKNIVGAPLSAADKLFDKSHIGVDKTFNFNNVNPIQSPNNDASTASFNAAAAASVSWNKIGSDTAALIDNVSLDLGKTTSGKLLNAASDDVFIGAWSGAAAVNWFTGGTGSQANQNAHKGALGAALAVNNLEQDVKAVISNSTINKVNMVENTAIKDGAEVAAALGVAVTNDSHGTGTNGSVTFGLSLNKTDSDIHALMIDNTSTNTNSSGTTFNNRAYAGDIQVAGGVDFSFANSANGGRAIAAGITAAVSEIENNIQSGIQGGTYTGVKDMKVVGEEAFTQVNAAVAIGVTTSEKGFTGTGSLAYADLDNKNHSYISGTNEINATGEVSVTDRDISSSGNVYQEYLEQRKEDPTGESYLSEETMEKLGAGEEAGSAIVNVAVGVSASKNSTVGAAITIGDVDNKFSSDITNNKKLEADAVKAAADVHTNIVSVAAGVSVSTKNFGGAGSLSFNDLKQDNIVSITGNRTVTTNAQTETVSEGITANTVSGTAKNTSHIVNVTGDFAGGKNAVGLGIAYNRMDDTTGVYAANNRIAAKTATNGEGVTTTDGVAISLDADNDAYALALSVGAAATYKDNGLVAAHGNFGVNRGHNDTIAVMGEDKSGYQGSEQIVNVSSVTAKATDDTSKTAIAGSGELALKDTTVALGIGVALTESDTADTEDGDGKETLRAEINNADITTVKKNGTAAVISATTKDESEATTVAVGVGFSKKSVIAADGIGADANIYKTNSAGLKDTTIDKNDTTKGALVTVKAETASNLDTGAAAGQLSLTDSLITGVVAVGVNRIKDTTSAGVTYTNKQASTSMNVGNLDISASSKGEILSVAAGAAGTFKGTAALGGSGSYNYIKNDAEASIVNADINSTGNVGVVAQSDEAISNYAGVLNVSGGSMTFAGAIGVTGSNNKISGNTSALIDNSKIVAKGSDSNKIKTKSKMNDSYLIDGAVTDNTWSAGSLKSGRQEEEETGVVVDASATHSIASVMANGGVAFSSDGLGLDVAGVINLNDIGGSTTAKILDSQINQAANEDSNQEEIRSDVNVHAADYTNLAEFSGAVSIGIGSTAAVAAGVTVNVNDISRVTTAGVSTSSATWNDKTKQYDVTDIGNNKNTIYAKDFSVTADAKQAMSSFNVAGAIAGGKDFAFETGDNVNINEMKSSTIALVTNATVDYTDNAKVEASHEDSIYNMNIDAGLSLAFNFQQGMAGSLNVGVGLVDESSTVTADVKNSALKKAESSSSASGSSAATLSIGANNKTTLDATLVSVGAAIGLFSVGVASSVAVNNIDTRVTSRIVGSELTADTLTINTGNDIKITDATGTGGGGLLAGAGVGVDVNTLSETVSTIVDNSSLTATNMTVNTGTQRDIASTVAGVGIGAAGISVNVLAVTVNEGVADLGYAEDADGNSTSFNHAETINQVLDTVNTNNDNDYSEYFHGMTKDEKEEMQKKTKTDIKAKQTVQGGTGVHTYVQDSTMQAVNALTVQNTEKNDADLNGGSGSMGGLAVNVADVVYHLNALNDISVKDSTVTGGSVSLTTHQGNKTADDNEAIMLQTVQAGLGGFAIGVGYAGLTTKGNTGITIDHGTLAATNGDLTVKSSDDARSKSNMIGVSAGSIAIPVSVAHNTNKANNFVTVKGGSTLTAATTRTQVVTDSQGNQATEKLPAYINLQTERSGRLAAKTIGVGVGAAAIVVNTAKVYDKSTSAITVEGSDTDSDTSSDKEGNTFTADAIRLEAVNAPVVRAEAGGTGVSLLGVSVMQSNAEAYSSAKVDVKDDNRLLGDAVLAQAVIGEEGTDMTHAETHGTNVSVGVGVNPNKAKAITETTASVNMGKETYKTVETVTQQTDVNGTPLTDEDGDPVTVTEQAAATSLALITQNKASRRAIMGNTTIGLVASIGTGDAKTTGNDKSLVTAKGGSGNEAVKLQNLKLAATGSNTAKGYADGDSGGITAWGASATITMKTKTTNTTSLSGAWDVTENADIGALQQVTSKGTSKTGAGGVLSVTWANSDNNVEMDTKTELKDGAVLNAKQSYVTAANKIVTGAYDGEKWNNHMDVGGVVQVAPDIKTEQKLTSKADVAIGSNAKVTTSKGQVYDAYTDMDVWNKVEGKGGGVAENVMVYSDNVVTSTNKITVDAGAELKQEGEFEAGSDITLSSSDKLKMDVVAEAWTGGLEGILIAEVENKITRNNGVEVNGKLTSTHDINLYSGVDADGSSSVVDITALAEAHNNTLLSFYTNAEIDQTLKNNQQVKVGSSGSAISVRNINVSAENGSETFRKHTVEVLNLLYDPVKKDKTVTNTPGESDIKETNDNYVNVDGLLKTGIQNNVAVRITGSKIPSAKDAAGNSITLTPTDNLPLDNLNVAITSENNENKLISVEDIVVGEMDYATQLGTQLAAVEKLIQEYSTGQGGDLVSYTGYLQQKQRILDEMESRGLYKDENGQRVYETSGYTIGYVEIPEISVSGGSIIVQSDTLYGNGRLEANGKPRVTITNESDTYLRVKGIQIGDEGGDIRFRGTSVANNNDITSLNKSENAAAFTNLKNDTASAAVSAVTITGENKVSTASNTRVLTYTTQDNQTKEITYTAIPDIAIVGEIRNGLGDVTIENRSSHGNITIGSDSAGKGVTVNGKTVQLIASTGSVAQDYVDGIVNIGGNPEYLNSSTAEQAKNISAGSMYANSDGYLEDYNNYKIVTNNSSELNQSPNDKGTIAGDSVYIAAADININGLIQSGYSRYIADISEDALSEENIQRYKNNGSEVTVQGRTMYKVNDGRKAVYNSSLGAYEYVVQVYYDPQTGGLVVEDIDANGGKIYLTGRISSTGNGRVLAMDGGADISITNRTSADLTTGKILNNDIEGKVTITDVAKNTWTEYTRSAIKSLSMTDYLASLNNPNAQVNMTTTEIAESDRYAADGGKKTTAYQVQAGQRYYWTMGTESGRTTYYHKKQNTMLWGGIDLESNTSKLEELEVSSNQTFQSDNEQRSLLEGTFIQQGTSTYVFDLSYQNRVTDSDRTVTGSWKEGGDWYALWSNPVYHTTWTTKDGATQSYTFSIKADRNIAVGFIGKKDGSINVANTNTAGGDVNLNGDILNNTKDATLTVSSAGGNIIQNSDATITTGKADFQAKENIDNIHITSMGERFATGETDADGKPIYGTTDGVVLSAVSSNAGNIDVEVVGGKADGQALPGNVVIERLFSEKVVTTTTGTTSDPTTGNTTSVQSATEKMGNVSLKAQGNITQTTDTVTVQGQKIQLISTNGSIGTFEETLNDDGTVQQLVARQAIVVESGKKLDSSVEDSASVNATAKKHIYLKENEGDMRVGSVISETGDVYLEATGGRILDALPQQDSGNNIDENDLVHHWIDAGLIAGTEDYEGAYIKGLKQDAANYAAKVEEQFEQFSLYKQFTKADGSFYTSAEEYLKADTHYQALTDSDSKAAYAAEIQQKYEQFKAVGSEISLRKQFTKKDGSGATYESAAAYLADDESYQVMKNTISDYESNVKYEFEHRNDGNSALQDKYQGYASADAYLAQNEEYQNLQNDVLNHKTDVENEFAHRNDGNSVLQAKYQGYTSAAAYLAQDDTYQTLQNRSQSFAADVENEFAHRNDGNSVLQAKYQGYASAEAYLAQGDTYYQTLQNQSQDFVAEVENEFSHQSENSDWQAKYQGYTSVETYLAQNSEYQNLQKDITDHEAYVKNEFAHRNDPDPQIQAKYQGFETAAAYLEQDDTYRMLQDHCQRFKADVENEFTHKDDPDPDLQAKYQGYASAEAYLEQDARYQMLQNQSQSFKADVENEFAHKDDPDSRMQAKYQSYTSAEAYLANDETYKDLLASSADYEKKVNNDFNEFNADASLRQKFLKDETTNTYYTSANEYLNADETYQNLVKTTQAKTTPYVREVNDKFNAFKKGDETYKAMFTKADGTTYDTVSQFLLEDDSKGGYLEMIAEQNAYEVKVCDEFSRFSTSKSNGQLTDMFTMTDGTTYESAAAYLATDKKYKELTDAYDPDLVEYAWTKEQLLYAIRNAIVNKESGENAETQSKVANVQGKNITLVAKGIGLNTNEQTVIKASALVGGTDDAIANMKLLSQADSADVTMKDKNNNMLLFTVVDGKQVAKAYDAAGNLVETDGVIDTFVIGNMSPLGVYATGKLNVTAIDDNAFIAGRSSEKAGFAEVKVGQITAGGHDVRLYTQEGIYNAAETQAELNQGNIHAKDLIAYGGKENIGTQAKPLTVSLSGDLLTANADKNVYIKNAKTGDLLRVGSVYAGDTIHLESNTGFAMTDNTDYRLGYLNAGKQLDLITNPNTGLIGTAVNPIRILNNVGTPEQYSGTAANNGMLINLTGKDAYVRGVNGPRGENTTMRLGLIEMAGDFTATSMSYLEAGAIRLGDTTQYGINGKINAGGDVVLEAVKDVVVNGPVKSTDGNIAINAGSEARINDNVNGVYANTGAISINAGTDAEINGKVVARTGDIIIFAKNNTEVSGMVEDGNGNISIVAGNVATINENAAVTTIGNAGSITISGDEGVTLNSTVKAGELTTTNPDEVDEGAVPVYEGGGSIYLTSEKGSIVQTEHGVLTAASVTTTSGNAIFLTNEGNTFRSFTANGVERDKTDEQGHVITDDNGVVKETAIDGSVTVYAHGGDNLNAAVNDTVYGDVELKNLDKAALTVTSDITAKAGKAGQAGSITLKQQGDILVQGNLTADGTVSEQTTGTGSVTNQKAVKAGQDVNLETVSGNITLNGATEAGNNINLTSVSGNSALHGKVSAGNDILILSGTGEVLTYNTMEAGRDIKAASASGRIGMGGVITAGRDLAATNLNGNVLLLGNISAGQDVKVQTSGDGGIMLSNPLETIFNSTTGSVHAGRHLTLRTENAGLVVAGSVTTDTGDVITDTKKGTILFMGEVEAGNNIEATITEGDETSRIQYLQGTRVRAGNDVTATTPRGHIGYQGNVFAGGSITAQTGKGNVEYAGNVGAIGNVVTDVLEGDITVKENVITRLGDVKLTTADGAVTVGSVTVGEDNETVSATGHIMAGGDVSILTKKGNATVKTSIGSENGSVSVKSMLGDIKVGEVPVEKAISAKENIDLYVTEGVITVNGHTTTQDGDITVKARNEKDNQNIVITDNGRLISGRDLTLHTYNGGIEVTDDTKAKRNLTVIVDNQGSVTFGKNVNISGTVSAYVKNGDVTIGEELKSGENVSLKTGSGSISVGADVIAGGEALLSTASGNITVGNKETGTGNVKADRDVTVTTGEGTVSIVKSVTSDNASVDIESGKGSILIGNNGPDVDTVSAKENITLNVNDGIIRVQGKTETQNGDITVKAWDEDDANNIVIEQYGQLISGQDLSMTAYNGDIAVTDATQADRNIIINIVNKGNISFDRDVDSSGSLEMSTKEGNITVGHNLTSEKDITLTSGKGDVTVGADVTAGGKVQMDTGVGNITVGDGTAGNEGAGNVTGVGNVTLNIGTGDVTINKTVTSTEGSIDISTQEGNIHIGDNGPDVKTVTAKEDVSLVTEEGKIEVYGKTSTTNGNITLKASNKEYVAGADGQNIIIDHNGRIDSGQDATLIAKKGDLHVTDRVKANRDLNAITQNKGDVFLDNDLNIQGSVTMKTDIGDIFADQNVKAGDRIVAATGNGNITVGTADAKYVSLTSGGEDGSVKAGTIRVQANGNSNGTGAEDVKLGGSHVAVDTLVNKSNGTTPLTIFTLGSAPDKPMQDLNIGKQNADLSYSGGIQSASGAVIQELWADRGMLYLKGDTNLHVSKLVIREKLHVANDLISVGVFGVPPYRDGARVVFWNDAQAKDPSGVLDRWYDRFFSDPMWMYLDLFCTGEVGSRYGVLMDTQAYNRIYGDSVSVVDTMRVRTDFKPLESNIAYFDRFGLLDYQEVFKAASAITNAQEEEIEIETEGK